jgi:hypothetical protein
MQARGIVYTVPREKREFRLACTVVESSSETTVVSESLVKTILREGARSMFTKGHIVCNAERKVSGTAEESNSNC